MKIVYTGLQYSNFNPKAGESFEYVNFYKSLCNFPGAEVILYAFENMIQKGREVASAELLNLVRREKPDLLFAFMFTDELLPAILDELKKISTTIAWFSDDHWRFDNYSSRYAPHFSWVATTYSKAVERYKKIGMNNVVRSQWAANTTIYKPFPWSGADNPAFTEVSAGRLPDVSFVGTWSKPRAKIIAALQSAGIKVAAYGGGWPNGRIGEQKMLEIFGNSKINLALNPAPGFFNKNSLGRLVARRSMEKIVPDFHLWDNFRAWFNRGIPQIKARHFEIPACGGLVFTGPADDLENYYIPDKEIVIYKNIGDLIEKVKYYLSHESERAAIARAGYERTLREHTYEHRFREIFKTIGLTQ